MNIILIGQISAIIILNVAIGILLSVLPKVYREARVKNGLIDLREALLISLEFILGAAITADIILLSRYVVPAEVFAYFAVFLLNVFCLSFLVIGLAKRRIYFSSFSPKQKRLHAKYAKDELLSNSKRDKRREVARVKLNSDRRKATRRKK